LRRIKNLEMYKKLIITLPHYSNPIGLLKTIKSISETFEIDIIIVDDGSFNKPEEKPIIDAYKNKGKIFFEYFEKNQGVGTAANRCLDFVKKNKYEYVARLDAGDICYPGKFKKQIKFLKKNKEIKLVGTWARAVDSKGKFLYDIKHPLNHNIIKRNMFLNSMFVNPTVVFDSSILKVVSKYPEKYNLAAHDYAFFFKVIKIFKSANLPEIMLDYVIDENSISSSKRKLQVKNRIKIILENFKPGVIPIYGLIRSAFLYFFSRSLITYLKRKIM
tara:strand:- start:465 stop:1286 length:822 start_codon:yes stop_codon:yes gene_type:complete